MFTLALGWSIKTHILIVISINRCQQASFFSPLSFIRRYKFNLFYNMNMHRKRKRCILTDNGENWLKMCCPGSARPFGTKKHQLCPKNTPKKKSRALPLCSHRGLRAPDPAIQPMFEFLGTSNTTFFHRTLPKKCYAFTLAFLPVSKQHTWWHVLSENYSQTVMYL